MFAGIKLVVICALFRPVGKTLKLFYKMPCRAKFDAYNAHPRLGVTPAVYPNPSRLWVLLNKKMKTIVWALVGIVVRLFRHNK